MVFWFKKIPLGFKFFTFGNNLHACFVETKQDRLDLVLKSCIS